MKNKDLNSEVIKMFCDTNNELRPLLNHPFTNGDITYATDTHFLAFVNSNILNANFPENEEMVKRCINVLPKPSLNISISVEELKVKIESVQKTDGFDIVRENIGCDACDGSGYVDAEFEHNLITYEVTVDCPACDGDGVKESGS